MTPMQTVLTPIDNLFAHAADWIEKSKSVSVQDAADAESAADLQSCLYEIEKGIESLRTEAVKPYSDEVKRINSHAKGLIQTISDAKRRFQIAIKSWQDAESARIAAENERLRLAAEAERKQIEEANAAAIRKAEEEAELIMAEAELGADIFGAPLTEAPELPAPEIIPPPPPPIQYAAPIKFQQTRKEARLEILDKRAIPVQFIAPIESLLLAEFRAGRAVPGVRFWYENVPVSKGFRSAR